MPYRVSALDMEKTFFLVVRGVEEKYDHIYSGKTRSKNDHIISINSVLSNYYLIYYSAERGKDNKKNAIL